ncbi:amino acid adenylation domain-containing protein [Streptomyces sp. NPDC053079]|uniref:amino acid adenylation domain-containing protein n=1 Tax=Streptomyces sp. NPDC053079 TaxID=3365697 RepID=UPI0037CFF7D8
MSDTDHGTVPEDDLAARIAALPAERRAAFEAILRRTGPGHRPHPGIRPHGDSQPPPSFGQERMWLLADLMPAAYNYATALRLRGDLVVPALHGAVRAIVRRHEALRTTFRLDGDRLTQVVHPPADVPVRIVDLTGRGADTGRLMREEARRPFDLESGPLLRVTLFRLGPREHVALLAVHHAVTDGWSNGVLTEELAAGYTDLCAGRPDRTPPPPVQYGDYARWQRERLDGPELTALTDFWAEAVRDLPRTALPTDHPRSAARRGEGANHALVLTPELTARLADLRRREGGSLFMLVLSALLVVVRGASGQDDLAVGTLVAGRTRPELRRLIGYFVNVLLLRFDAAGHASFLDLWRRVRERLVAAYAHQELPLEKVLELLRSDGAAAPTEPPVSVVCVAQQPAPAVTLPGLEASAEDVDLGTAQFDLVVEVRERPEGLQIAFQYDRDLFADATVRLLGDHLRTVLEQAAADPSLPCAELPHTPPQAAPAPAATAAPTLHQLFEAQAAKTPDAVAVVDGDHRISYRALNTRANRLARHLRARGVRTEDRVALDLPPGADAVTATLAVLKAGAAYVPLDPGHPRERLAAILADARPTAVLTAASLRDEAAAIARYAGHDLGLPVHADNLAHLLHTSGSTGEPKGVLGPHRGAVNRVAWMSATHPFAPGDVSVARTAPGFVDAVWELFGPLLAGVPLLVLPPDTARDPALLVRALEEQHVSRIVTVPSLLTMLLAEDTGDTPLDTRLACLRTWITSGEPLHPDLAHRFHTRLPGRTLLNLYGSCEVAGDATAARIDPHRADGTPLPARSPVGTPITGASALVRDARLRPLPAPMPGELFVGGACLARGYHDRPAATAAAFLPDPHGTRGARVFRTGDVARQRADGHLELLGRTDRQVQIRGHRAEPGEVERALLAHPEVRAAAVTANPDATGLWAYVQPEPGATPPAAAELTGFLRTALPAPLVPTAITVLNELPTTPHGKTDYRRLPEPDPSAARAPWVAPRTATEATVAGVFADALALDRPPGAHDDFFLLGGHSLLAARVAAELRGRCGVDVGLRDVFAAPTVAALADRVAGRTPLDAGESTAFTPDPGARHEPFPLTDVQRAYYVGREGGFALGGVSTYAYLEIETPRLDLERFTGALRGVIDRHPMLRAVIRPDGLQQVLAEVPPYEVAVHDLRETDEAGQRHRRAALREEMSHQVVPADRWPLFDVRVSIAPTTTVVHVGVDALVCDAHSFGLVMAELAARYTDPAREFAPQTAGFRDHVLHQQRLRSSARYEEALAYWRRRLPALPPGPELPLATSPESIGTPHFERRSGRLDAASWAVIKERARAAGLSPSGVLLAAFAEVITAWSGRPRYSLMLTVFDRRPVHPDIGRIVGDFTSLSLLEVDHGLPGDFTDRARRLQGRLWEDLDHSAVSGVTVMREWALHRDAPPRLLTPVVFTSNLPVGDTATDGADGAKGEWSLGEPVFGISQTPQVHLDHQVAEDRGELVFNWDAVEELFAPGVLDAMFDAYTASLARLAADPGAWKEPGRPPLPAAQAAVRDRVGATAAPLPTRLLHEAVADAARRRPEATAVVAGDTRLTYRELTSRARRVGHTLRRLGARPNQLVAVVARKGWQQAVAALGVLESGAAFLPLDPELPAERLVHLTRRGECAVVLTQRALLDELAVPAGVTVLAVDDDTALDDSPGPLETVQTLTDLAYTIFTSGSTGEPKGVMIDHLGAANTLECVNRRFATGPDDAVLAVSSLSFDLAVYDLFGVLAAGGTLVVPAHARRRDPGHWADLVRREGVTLWNSVPALGTVLAEYAEALAPDALRTLRAVMFSGDWIPLGLPDRIRALAADGATVMSLGGATEGSIWSVWYEIGRVDPRWRSIPYGTPLANQRLAVLDEDLRPRPDWVPGELYIGGTGVARGYWRDPEQTARRFPSDPTTGRRLYRTGDYARHLPDGTLEFLGRQDDQVKISGYRVELGEIEAALERLDDVAAGAVIAVGEPRGERRLVGFAVPAPGRPFEAAALRQTLAAHLPGYMVPATLLPLERLPLTANGKVDRAALQRLVPGRDPDRTEPAAPPPAPARPDAATAVPDRLGALWCEALGVQKADPDAGFFALGGTSLVAITLATRIQAELGVRIPIARLFDARTLGGLAAAVAELAPAAGPDTQQTITLDPASRHEPFPLTDIQQAYWLGRHRSLSLGGVATHTYLELDVDDLDPARLQSALRALIERHEALRLVVRPDGLQQVLPHVPPYVLAHTDLRGRADAADELERVREEMSHEVRDASAWPLFDLRTHRLDDVRTRLHLSLDLLIADAHSVHVLTRELLSFYHDPAAELPPLGCSFRDYVLAVRAQGEGEPYRRAVAYWRDRLADLPPAPGLPLLCRPEELTAPKFTRLVTGLDATAWARVRARAAGAELTPAALVCAAFCEVLAQWSDDARFTLNLTTFHRPPLHPGVDDIVGDFTTTTLLAVDGEGETFADRAQRLQQRIWQDLEHRVVSGVEVLRMLRRERGDRDGGRMPIVFTSTLLPAGAAPQVTPLSWRVRPVYAISQTPQVLLDHQVSENDGRLVCNWDFVADAFPPGLIEAMFGAFEAVLASLAADDDMTGGGPE